MDTDALSAWTGLARLLLAPLTLACVVVLLLGVGAWGGAVGLWKACWRERG